MIRTVRTVALLGILAVASPASAQVTPTSPPHPNMPWNPNNPTRAEFGDFMRYVQVPPQQVVIPMPVPGGQPGQVQQQSMEIPGYVVTETTTGYWLPERTTLVQVSAGVYQWQKLPMEFKKK